MLDRHSGRPRGFGFVTFADSVVADRVLKQEHVIDDRTVEVKKTVPREDMDFKGLRVKKIFVGGLPPSLTEDELKEYFVFYGGITEYQIMYDHTTGRSRGFGFVTFESEDSVERLFADRRTHELGGKEVEIKKAEPRRFGGGGDYGSTAKPYGGGFNDTNGYGAGRGSGGRYSGKMGRGGGGYGGAGGYGSYPAGFNGYGGYGAGYPGGAAGLYGAYGGYGYGFGFNNLMMYGNGMYGGGGGGGGAAFSAGYGAAAAGYGASKGYERSGDAGGSGGRGYSSSGGGAAAGGKSYGGSSSSSGGGGGNAAGRHHPYRK
ncbi:Heterogeneous nuclear ribonucleoprotein 1 [Linum perenne]